MALAAQPQLTPAKQCEPMSVLCFVVFLLRVLLPAVSSVCSCLPKCAADLLSCSGVPSDACPSAYYFVTLQMHSCFASQRSQLEAVN